MLKMKLDRQKLIDKCNAWIEENKEPPSAIVSTIRDELRDHLTGIVEELPAVRFDRRVNRLNVGHPIVVDGVSTVSYSIEVPITLNEEWKEKLAQRVKIRQRCGGGVEEMTLGQALDRNLYIMESDQVWKQRLEEARRYVALLEMVADDTVTIDRHDAPAMLDQILY